MTNLLERIQSGEGLDLEFKASLPEESVKWLKTVVAFANGRGGTLVIGVSDDREVLGISNPDPYSKCDDMVSVICNSCTPQIPVSTRVQTVGGKSLIVLDVFPGISRPYYIKDLGEENGTFIRVGATSRLADSLSLQDLRIQGAKTTFDTIENREVSVTPENTDSICSSLSRLGGKTVSSTDLENAQVIRSMDGHKVPTNAYALMMSDSPFKFTEFRCAVFSDSDGSTFLDHADYQCPIQSQLDLAYQFVLRNIRLIGKVEGLIRRDVYEIPEEAVRELILNAIQHRSYIDASRPIYLAIYNDKLVITSPGGLPSQITVDSMKEGSSYHRNPAITKIFRRAGFSEGWGNGIKAVMRLCRDAGLREPLIENTGIEVRVTVYRDVSTSGVSGVDSGVSGVDSGVSGVDSGVSGVDQTDDARYKILSAMMEDPGSSIKDIQITTGISRRTIDREISRMKNEGILIRTGTTRNGQWVIRKTE